MVVDSSAVVSIVRAEPGHVLLVEKLMAAPRKSIAAPNALEVHLVLKKWLGEETERIVAAKLTELGIEIVPFGAEHLAQARLAFDRFGKGRHPARLNFGDCVAYALARVSGQPLLFTGDDFGKTDIPAASR